MLSFFNIQLLSMKLLTYTFILILFMSCFGLACQLSHPPQTVPNPSLIKIGDWIFRKGTQTDSLIVRQISGDEYSHIGMVVAVDPEIQIIHATTDDDHNHSNQVIISSLAEFITPKLAEKFAIARPNFLTTTQQQQIVNYLLTRKGDSFIIAPKKDEHLYCTTLLSDAISRYYPDFKVEWQYVNFPLLNGFYLFPSAFAKHDDITWIYQSPAQTR